MACEVARADIVVIDEQKVKARAVRVLYECDEHGYELDHVSDAVAESIDALVEEYLS